MAFLVNSMKHLTKNKISSTETISKIDDKGTNYMSPVVAYRKTRERD